MKIVMIYGVCSRCGHTKDGAPDARFWYSRCYSCGAPARFVVYKQLEQPDGSVIEVRA